jgi:DNA ligase (NAD+)
MKNLEALIKQARIAYYNGKPLMSDEAYDRLEEQLGVATEVGHDLTKDKGARYPHAFPMYSLQKAYSIEEHPNYGNEPVTVTPKLDGAAVSLQYIRGELSLALTRGDGKHGLDITDNMRFLIPRLLTPCMMGGGNSLIQITGEVVAPATIKNSRNYAAGALSLHDSNEFQQRDLTFIAYGVQPYPTEDFIEDMEFLNQCGFETIIDSNYPMFPQDGEVWRIINNDAFEKLGYTSHHPRGAFAKKTKQTGIVTKLLDVVWQVGKSGNVSPVGILEPIEIGGATVSRATLHNIGIIEDLGLEIGCMVEVIRAGEIIPQVVARID